MCVTTCICVYTHAYTCIYRRSKTQLYTYIYTTTNTNPYTYINVVVLTHTYVWLGPSSVRTCCRERERARARESVVCVCVCGSIESVVLLLLCVCVCVCVCVCKYTDKHRSPWESCSVWESWPEQARLHRPEEASSSVARSAGLGCRRASAVAV